jgi:hypothetical protein
MYHILIVFASKLYYYKTTKQELVEYCDRYLTSDTEIKDFCEKNNIPSKEV